MAAQSSHFFYPVCIRAEQPAGGGGKLFLRHGLESASGAGGFGHVQHRLSPRRTVDDAALVEKATPQNPQCACVFDALF